MHPLLTELGVSEELQAYFYTEDLCFEYANDKEYFGEGFHLVPVTADLWMAGNYPATELIITASAMEAIAYLALNQWRHPANAVLSFIAIGNLPHARQLGWISSYCQKRKITLVFGNDLLGRLADIAVASGIRGKAVRLCWQDGMVMLYLNHTAYRFAPERLSLNAFEKAAGFRTAIRTRKPTHHHSFLEQLQHDSRQ
ncbi:hypothetical protein [Mucilaginibacter aquariorum]|uniref:Uncharacterized protein n=1 Tax=Mucilaginibacter aquariorum TaxID=2967225 RepID=A0ABT1SXR5_9SPHI|nr:hypothetical protein [Mucilaginibacter aquariorum]MCQ6957052.1 hypothetical protein [Mucilaginibacter aquariorum]